MAERQSAAARSAGEDAVQRERRWADGGGHLYLLDSECSKSAGNSIVVPWLGWLRCAWMETRNELETMEVLIVTEKLNDTEATGPDGATFLYLRVSADGQLQVAVAYLRTSAEGDERDLALVEQQNALQRFADEASYKVVHWYVDADCVEVSEPALSRLMADVVSEGRRFNAVLVWNYSRLTRNPAELAELTRKLREHDIDLVSVADGSSLIAWERQLAELSDGLDEEAAS